MLLTEETGGKEFEVISADTHNAVCVGVYDIGLQESQYGTKRQLIVLWEVDEQDEGGNKTIPKFYTASIHPKSTLRQDIISWYGRDLVEEERTGFDPQSLVGKPCMLGVIHTENGKAKVQNISKPPKGMPTLKATGDYSETPKWIKKKQGEAVGDEEPAKETKAKKPNPQTQQEKRDAAVEEIFD